MVVGGFLRALRPGPRNLKYWEVRHTVLGESGIKGLASQVVLGAFTVIRAVMFG